MRWRIREFWGFESFGGADGFVGFAVGLDFELEVLVVHFEVDEGGLGLPETAFAPDDSRDLPGEMVFMVANGLVDAGEIVAEFVEVGFAFVAQDEGAVGS